MTDHLDMDKIKSSWPIVLAVIAVIFWIGMLATTQAVQGVLLETIARNYENTQKEIQDLKIKNAVLEERVNAKALPK